MTETGFAYRRLLCKKTGQPLLSVFVYNKAEMGNLFKIKK